MKKIAYLIFASFLIIALNSSCDPCKKKDCGQYGNCDNGDCICDCGASKDADGKCNVNDRDQYIASYIANGTTSDGGSFSNFNFRCNPSSDAFNSIEFDLSEINFPKFKGEICSSPAVVFDPFTDSSTGDAYIGSASRSGNILTLSIERTTSIGSKTTYTFTGNKQ